MKIVDPFKSVRGLNFLLLQVVTFSYFCIRMLSRDYSIYGYLESGDWTYPREISMELTPFPICNLTTFHFIYDWIPSPSVGCLVFLQIAAVIFCVLGVLGILPKLSAWICFLLGLHLTGFTLATNGDIEGSIVCLYGLFSLAIAPREAFISVLKAPRLNEIFEKHWYYQFPVFVFMLLTGFYYSFAGLEKLIETGFHWPFVLHPEWLAENGVLRSMFLSNRYSHPLICTLFFNPVFGVLGSILALYAELFCLSVLFWRRGRLFIIVTLSALHVIVFYLGGINFLGSIPMLFLMLDWNRLISPFRIILPRHLFGKSFISMLKLTGIDVVVAEQNHIELVEDGRISEGGEAFLRLSNRVFLPSSLIYSIPLVGDLWAKLVKGIVAGKLAKLNHQR